VPRNPLGAPANRRDFLFVQSTTEIGGAETVLLNLLEASEELRRRSLVVTLGFGEGDLPKRLRALGAEVVELGKARLRHPWKVLQTLRQLRVIARASGARVVIGNGGHPQIIAGAVARLARARSVFVAHMIYATPVWKNDPRDILALMGPCDLMLAVSKSAQATLSQLRPSVPNRLLYNGTPIREVAPSAARARRAELGAADGDVLIGVFGRLQRWKGQDVFVKAAGEVARRRPNTRFVIVGGSVFGLEPEYLDELRREVVAQALADRLVFTGFRTDVPELMSACDVVCHTTRVAEPFGLVIVEAMAVGRPVVATAGGGPSEIIASDAEGVLVPSDDPGALTRAIIALVDDPARRRTMGDRARARVRAQFSMDVMASTLIGYLDDLISPKS
jgi:glycosyltransferase involved in cell wall biosynthesis